MNIFKHIIILIFILLISCQKVSETNQVSVLNGRVFYLDEENQPVPLEDAMVRLVTANIYAEATRTDMEGKYQLILELENDHSDVTIEASKIGFTPTQFTLTAMKGKKVNVPDMALPLFLADSLETAELSGAVFMLDEQNKVLPLGGTLILCKDIFAQATTDTSGKYYMEIELDEDEKEITLEATKIGFELKSQVVIAKMGVKVMVPAFELTMKSTKTDTNESGIAAQINIKENYTNNVYVRDSGLRETSRIDFLVTDIEGKPVDGKNRTLVYFSLLNGPGGGEAVVQDTMTTQDGMVHTVLISGDRTGAVTLNAYFISEGRMVLSSPVVVNIYGGLPDENHFSLVLDKKNIAGRINFGLVTNVTAYVSDQFNNPVAPGTMVYFSADYGIIESSTATDELGRATVRFTTANPLPPADSSFVHITAQTQGSNEKESTITDRLLLSDRTNEIESDSTDFSYTNENKAVPIVYSVADINGNPLVEGTIIEVTCTAGNLYGDIYQDLSDTQEKGKTFTEFTFTWLPGANLAVPEVYINIKVSTPKDGNNGKSLTIKGTKG
jgi:hypothetical protein